MTAYYLGVKLQGIKLGDFDINEGDNRIKIYSMALHDLLEASIDPAGKENYYSKSYSI